MNILINPIEIEDTICSLIKSYENISFATAWASGNSKAFQLLLKNTKKINKIIVGIHFYQTNPNFIKEFLNSEKVKFITNPTGIFHPKIYLFSNNDNNWECLIGSANFTKSAFEKNSEVMIHFSSDDTNSKEVYEKITTEINEFHRQAVMFTSEDLYAYQIIWDKKAKKILDLQDKFGKKEDGKPIYKSKIITLNWDNYLNLVKNDKIHSYNMRLELLAKAKNYFKNTKFKDISIDNRLKIAGITRWDNALDWHCFGKMTHSVYFANGIKIEERINSLSDALEYIPTKGTILKEDYIQFLDSFVDKNRGWGYGVSTVSRILAMKRPDVFFCLTTGNGELLYKNFGIQNKINTHDYERYWDEIIQRIHKAEWFNSPKPKNKEDKKLWENRVAMLDAVFYDGGL